MVSSLFQFSLGVGTLNEENRNSGDYQAKNQLLPERVSAQERYLDVLIMISYNFHPRIFDLFKREEKK
eukprot:snap_masked-scaffold_20-processed-gene-2.19-mRNA-1 protein AED:1.00 eAED:1.00 QI:0/0/0/0/1/1/2/0/67